MAKVRISVDIDELVDSAHLRNLIIEQVYAMTRDYVHITIQDGIPALEDLYPCFRCKRRSGATSKVVDRWPNSPHMKDNPKRFMHASGLCPEAPSKAPSEPSDPFDAVDPARKPTHPDPVFRKDF